jgi:hypothetical protein
VKARTVAATTAPPSRPGDDAHLDSLYRACGQGDWGACDALYQQSAPGTEYSAYGDTCGNVDPPGTRRYCADLHQGTIPNRAGDDTIPNQLG